LVLTNDDVEEGSIGSSIGGADFADQVALTPLTNAGAPYFGQPHFTRVLDDDLLMIRIGQVPYGTAGSFDISLSNPSNARLYDYRGQPLTNGTAHILATSGVGGFVSGLAAGDQFFFVEGLHPDADLAVEVVQRDFNGIEVSHDHVHLAIAQWQTVDSQGVPAQFVESISSGALQVLADQPTIFQTGNLSGGPFFRTEIVGLPTGANYQLEGQSVDDPSDRFLDSLDQIGAAHVSSRFVALYNGEPIPDSDRVALHDKFGLIGVHNPNGRIKLTTGNDLIDRDVAAAQVDVTVTNDFVKAGGHATITVRIPNPKPGVEYELAVNATNAHGYDGAAAQIKTGVEATFDIGLGEEFGLRKIVIGLCERVNGEPQLVGAKEIAAAVVSESQFNSQYHKQAWDDLHVDGFVPAYAQLGLPITHLRMLNNQISAQYAKMF
jgi:hypothetical protein